MSFVAEFARTIHEKNFSSLRKVVTSLTYASRTDCLYGIKAVIFDVYGTLVNYWREGFSDEKQRQTLLLEAFRKTADFFGFAEFLDNMNPDDFPEKTLNDLYHGLITLNHEKSLKKGTTFPEVRIEEVWQVIIMMLERHGYDMAKPGLGGKKDLAKCVAYYYNSQALGGALYNGVVPALMALQQKNIKLGILSNAQFYTPIDLTLFIRDQSLHTLDDYTQLFCDDLIFFSYEYGVAKPNQILFRALFDALYELHILPSQTVFVGNDLSLDIKPAAEIGMATAFFTGDTHSAFMHDLGGKIVPDIVFDDWATLPRKISFFEKK